ncbi:hypothetical protein HDU67_001570 [Dinochytrium kinnereticum]|nr:hypothetical protein HDU67_001570 [Dinochytrium kinnereticum]
MTAEPTTEVSALEVEDNTFKVFAGNLAFSITEDDLKNAFSEAGAVTSANIIVRNNRSLGYGFVSFLTEAEAKKAVELMDKVELAGRQLNVEVAKPKAAGGEQKSAAPRRRGKKGNNAAPAADGAAPTEDAPAPAKRRGGREARIDQDGEQPEATEGGDAPKKPRARRNRKPRKPRGTSANPTSEGEGQAEGATSDAPGARRGRRQKREKSAAPADGPLSKTMLFVANLPFKADNETLASIFKDYKLTSSKVVTLRNGRSKGFGFVEVENEEEQARVMSELKNVQVDGRELIIKVALQSSHAQVHGEGEEAAEQQQ